MISMSELPQDMKQRQAEILTQAMPYIQKYQGKIVVIKYGGNAMVSDQLKQQVMEDVALLHMVGVRVVLVHGGGPEISHMLDRLGKESTFVNGLRVTDEETVEVAQMVLSGKVNKGLVAQLERLGAKAVGLSGLDGGLIRAAMKDPELGYVGRITGVDPSILFTLLDSGYIPVVSTVAGDLQGNTYNINADTAASYIAGAVGAERLFMMTDIAGVLRDRDDPESLLPCIDIDEAVQLFNEGVISGGMIPKIECCIDAVLRGVNRVIIMDGRVPHSILLEILTSEGVGTMVMESKNDDDKTA